MPKQIFTAEINLENAPAAVRSLISGNDLAVASMIKRLQRKVDEVFVLVTGTRYVVYAFADKLDHIMNVFLQEPKLIPYTHFCRSTLASLNHVLGTAAGLCSPVIGEQQVIRQLKHAHGLANQCESIGLMLDNLIRTAIRTGRNVRAEASLESYVSLYVDCGMEQVFHHLNNVADRKYLVIGNNRMSKLVLASLRAHHASDVMLLGSDDEKAFSIAHDNNAVVISPSILNEVMESVDVVINTTDHDQPELAAAISNLSAGSIYIDYSLRSPIAGVVREESKVKYIGFNDIRKMCINEDTYGPQEHAWRLVSEAATVYYKKIAELENTPVLASYWNKSANIGTSQMNWLVPTFSGTQDFETEVHKLHKPMLSQEDTKQLLNYTVDSDRVVTSPAFMTDIGFWELKMNFNAN